MKPTQPEAAISDELLQRYFDGELGPVERREVEARLDGDARLRLEALAELRGLLRAHVAADPGVDLSGAIDAIERATPIARAPRSKRRWLPMSAAGGFLAAAAALVLFLHPITPSQVTGDNHADVESLEVQGALATVFRVANGDDEATIIWAEDEAPSDNATATE